MNPQHNPKIKLISKKTPSDIPKPRPASASRPEDVHLKVNKPRKPQQEERPRHKGQFLIDDDGNLLPIVPSMFQTRGQKNPNRRERRKHLQPASQKPHKKPVRTAAEHFPLFEKLQDDAPRIPKWKKKKGNYLQVEELRQLEILAGIKFNESIFRRPEFPLVQNVFVGGKSGKWKKKERNQFKEMKAKGFLPYQQPQQQHEPRAARPYQTLAAQQPQFKHQNKPKKTANRQPVKKDSDFSDVEDDEEEVMLGGYEKIGGQKKQYDEKKFDNRKGNNRKGEGQGNEREPRNFNDRQKINIKSEIEQIFTRAEACKYQKFLEPEAVEAGLKAKTLFRGTVIRKQQPPFTCFIKGEDSQKVFFKTGAAMNRALPGSTVIYRVCETQAEQQARLKEAQKPKTVETPKKEKKESPKQVPTDKNDDADLSWVTEEDDEESNSGSESDMNMEQVSSESESEAGPVAPNKKKQDADNQSIRVKGEVVYIETNPYATKDIIVKIERFRKGNDHYLYARPIDKKLPHLQIINIPEFMYGRNPFEDFSKKYFSAKYRYWGEKSKFPFATIEGEFGACGDVEMECAALLIDNEVFHDKDFSDEVYKHLEKYEERVDKATNEYKIPQEERDIRMDLTKENIFTIDPATARDLDDALSITLHRPGVYKVGVHIADVSHFVAEGTPVDGEASLRTTSIYFPHRVIPMLPRLLCDNLCSLNPGVERLAFSIYFYLSETGELLTDETPIISKSIIRSVGKFSYDVVQKILDCNGQLSPELTAEVQSVIKGGDLNKVVTDCILLNKVAQLRRKMRLDNGSLTFNRTKKRYMLDKDRPYPLEFYYETRKEANFLVEEYMLLANMLIGDFMTKNCRDIALLRQHEIPGDKKVDFFNKMLQELNLPYNITAKRNIKEFLEQIAADASIPPNLKKILEFNSVRLLELAKYFIAKDTPQSSWLHFALQFDVYTHFTSPIRRYPDLLVHRIVHAILQKNTKKLDYFKGEEMMKIIEDCNDLKRKSRLLSDGTEKLFMCLYLRDHPNMYEGLITKIEFDFIYVLIPLLDIEMRIGIKNNKQVKDYRKVSQKEYTINCYKEPERGPASPTYKVTARLYDNMKVQVTATEVFPIDYKVLFVEA